VRRVELAGLTIGPRAAALWLARAVAALAAVPKSCQVVA
jgi:hypothetical protein